MILKKSDKFMKKAAVYSLEVHFLLFFMILGSSFLPKKEPLLLTDIEIAGEGEFREAMEIARNSDRADKGLIATDDGSSPSESDRNPVKENLANENQVRNIPEMVDELKVPEEEPPVTEPSPLPPHPSQELVVDTTPKADPLLESSGGSDQTPKQQHELESESNEVSESLGVSEEVADKEASKVVPIETPDEEDTTIKNESEEAKKKETDKKEAEKKEAKKDEKKAESAKKKKTDPKKKPKNKSKKKDKSKDQSKKKKKMGSVIKRIEKAQKQKNRRQKILDLAEKAEKSEKAIRDKSSEKAAFDGGEGSGRGDNGNGVGAFGVGTALVESDYEIISGQIYPYWVVPSGVKDAENIVIEIHIELGDNGEVIPSSIKILDEKKYVADQVFRAAADSARRAILQASPLSIPKEKLEAFKAITLRFNLKEALAE